MNDANPAGTGKTIRIVVADDHFVVRMGLAALVKTEPDMEVIGEASDGNQAVELFEKLQPDLVLMDLRMPVKDGIAAATEICAKHPNARILMLTTYDGDTDIHRAMQAGARGYVLKKSTGDDLIPALRAVAAGQKWIPKEISTRLASRKLFEELTPRELQVLAQLAKGLANKEIGDALKITEHTVKDHLKNILGKLHVADRTEAVTVALQRGIIQLP
jgi:DNA-binding NarL/FixJ family response regulator